MAAFLALSTVSGSVHSAAVTTDSAPLAAAGGPAPAVVGYVGVGLVRVYVPWTVVPTIALGELVALSNTRRRTAVALALGVTGAGQLLVVSGCGCGGGAVRPLAAVLPGVPG
ncbi:hypothetical protein [Halomicrobium salinisoli]|uniref:hypothetical protein n=1 Tax=Halomicrobium salinisoli TaxID=2878391 RepID=UPI001CF0344B|nr:hypothetical protein [Halomicrobium salinisoli]